MQREILYNFAIGQILTIPDCRNNESHRDTSTYVVNNKQYHEFFTYRSEN